MEIQNFSSYLPMGVAVALAMAFSGLFVALAVFIGPSRVTPTKNIPFECGYDPIGSPRGRYSVKFYQVALLFLVFDIEAAFMYPWAVLFRDLSIAPITQANPMGGVSLFGFTEMLLFVAVLVVALAYVWRKKAIGWD